jgi:ribose-phosphate pyrophosphokinase
VVPPHFDAHAARGLGAVRVGLVAPYLSYMRQDAQFHAGEAVSARAYADFLSSSLDWIATVDPHLHRIRSLDDIFRIPALCISAMPAIGEWIAGNVADPVIVGPDSESRQWAESVAIQLGVPWTVLEKTRTGDRQVSVRVMEPAMLRGRSAVIVDDIASSGQTLAEAARALLASGSLPVTCVIVHALLSQSAEAGLRSAGVARLVSTNTLDHPASAIDVTSIVARQVRPLLATGHANA